MLRDIVHRAVKFLVAFDGAAQGDNTMERQSAIFESVMDSLILTANGELATAFIKNVSEKMKRSSPHTRGV
jgi:hypothetical protein